MSGGPLTGRTVVVTRAREQASRMGDLLASLGATVLELPVIATEAPADRGRALEEAAGRLVDGAYGWVALTSANGAARLLAALRARTVPAAVGWAVLGEGTAAVLRDAGVAPDLVAEVSSSEGLVDAFPTGPSADGVPGDHHAPARRVLFPRAETVRGSLAAGLRSRGWTVDEVVAYRTVAGDPDPAACEGARQADAIAFTSSSTVERTVSLLGSGGVPRLVASIGPTTSRTARDAGLEVTVEAEPHTIEALVEALARALGSAHPDDHRGVARGGPGRPGGRRP